MMYHFSYNLATWKCQRITKSLNNKEVLTSDTRNCLSEHFFLIIYLF